MAEVVDTKRDLTRNNLPASITLFCILKNKH
jgi:hypothetical protein